MYVWAAFEAKSPPTRQDLVTLIPNSSLKRTVILVRFINHNGHKAVKNCYRPLCSKCNNSAMYIIIKSL